VEVVAAFIIGAVVGAYALHMYQKDKLAKSKKHSRKRDADD
jgi:hypothetical protein